MPSFRLRYLLMSNDAVQGSMRNLPSVDALLRSELGREIADAAGDEHAAQISRSAIAEVREHLSNDTIEAAGKTELLAGAVSVLKDMWEQEDRTRLRRVINATGVIIHTNLGRAPLSENARRAVKEDAAGYCNLEYDLDIGKRGSRAPRSEMLITDLTGAEAALVVNNCAAAAFFVLTVFAAGCRVAISRGELVEIGGDFRVPDVLSQSGATLHEVGTTNRTRLSDYEKAIDDGAAVILRVHPSNYRIIGFTATPPLRDLASLAHGRGVLLYEDIGSGALIDLAPLGLPGEPIVADSIRSGVDLVTFSGDKLLGGPQAGIIAGRRDLIERLKKHPLYRALRVDKLINAALESTLEAYRRKTESEIPVIAMLGLDKTAIRERVERIAAELGSVTTNSLTVQILDGVSAVGGGAAPAAKLDTALLALSHPKIKSEDLERSLRKGDPPVIARIENGLVLLDLRTVAAEDEPILIQRIRAVAG